MTSALSVTHFRWSTGRTLSIRFNVNRETACRCTIRISCLDQESTKRTTASIGESDLKIEGVIMQLCEQSSNLYLVNYVQLLVW